MVAPVLSLKVWSAILEKDVYLVLEVKQRYLVQSFLTVASTNLYKSPDLRW